MTTFNPDKAIYLQMADRLCDEILAGTYRADDRVPSVREYAVLLQVNTNTAVTGGWATSSPPGRARVSWRPAAASSWGARCPPCSAT